MSHLRHLLKRAGLSANQLAEGTGISIRTIGHHYNTGRMPYTILYKIQQATGLTMDEIVPKHLAEYWLSLWDESEKVNKPRGYKKNWQPGDNVTMEVETEKETMVYHKGVEDVKPSKKKARSKKVPRETSKPKPVPQIPIPAPIPKTVTPSLPKTVTTQKGVGKRSIADIMQAAPVQSTDEGAPDFSNIDDSLFATSMDVTKKKR